MRTNGESEQHVRVDSLGQTILQIVFLQLRKRPRPLAVGRESSVLLREVRAEHALGLKERLDVEDLQSCLVHLGRDDVDMRRVPIVVLPLVGGLVVLERSLSSTNTISS